MSISDARSFFLAFVRSAKEEARSRQAALESFVFLNFGPAHPVALAAETSGAIQVDWWPANCGALRMLTVSVIRLGESALLSAAPLGRPRRFAYNYRHPSSTNASKWVSSSNWVKR